MNLPFTQIAVHISRRYCAKSIFGFFIAIPRTTPRIKIACLLHPVFHLLHPQPDISLAVDVAGIMDIVSDARAHVGLQAQGELTAILALGGVQAEVISHKKSVSVLEFDKNIALIVLSVFNIDAVSIPSECLFCSLSGHLM